MEAVNPGCQGNKIATSFVSRALSFHILSWPFMAFSCELPLSDVQYTPRTSTSCVSKLQNDHIMQPYFLLSPAVNCWAH